MPAKKNTELAAIDAAKFQIEAIDTTVTAEDISEELDGLGTVPLDRAKFPGSGGTQFEISDEDDEDETVNADSITGVIVHHHSMNSRWERAYEGSQEPPVCSSQNGKTGLNIQTGEVIACADCPFNQFGSATGNTKACKNIHRLFIARDGNPVPLIVSLPPTSLRSFKNYVSKKLLMKGKKCNQVITKISLKKEKSQSGMNYAKAVFERAGDLSDKQIADAVNIGNFIKNIVTAEAPICASDYNMAPPAESEYAEPSNAPAPMPALPQPVHEEPPAPTEAPPVNDEFDFIDVEENPFA